MSDRLSPKDKLEVMMSAGGKLGDAYRPHGHFDIRCLDNAGTVLWEDGFDNILPTVGLDQLLSAGAASSATYMGLISSVGYSALVAGDTMASHTGWNEVANSGTNTPPYGTVRPTVTWSTPAGGIINAGTSSFVFIGSGTVEGGFLTNGSGASATVGATTGVLFSEGTLATAQPVISGNTLQMTYTLTL